MFSFNPETLKHEAQRLLLGYLVFGINQTIAAGQTLFAACQAHTSASGKKVLRHTGFRVMATRWEHCNSLQQSPTLLAWESSKEDTLTESWNMAPTGLNPNNACGSTKEDKSPPRRGNFSDQASAPPLNDARGTMRNQSVWAPWR